MRCVLLNRWDVIAVLALLFVSLVCVIALQSRANKNLDAGLEDAKERNKTLLTINNQKLARIRQQDGIIEELRRVLEQRENGAPPSADTAVIDKRQLMDMLDQDGRDRQGDEPPPEQQGGWWPQ